MNAVLTLVFHEILSDSGTAAGVAPAARRYLVGLDFFEALLAAISHSASSTLGRFAVQPGADDVILTFDDGCVSDYDIAYPALASRGLKGTFYLTVQNLGTPGYLDVEQAREMARAGMEMASHGLTHRYLTAMSRAEATEEIVSSRTVLEQILGLPITSFAPVGGHFRPWMLDRFREAGYHTVASMIPGCGYRSRGGVPIFRRNHLQAHHSLSYASRLLGRHRWFLAENRLRYEVLHWLRRGLGMRNYDRVKALLIDR